MFGRRVPPKTVFLLSLILALVFGAWASYALQNQQWWSLGISGVLAVWFAIDSWRAYGWWQAAEKEEAEKRAQEETQV